MKRIHLLRIPFLFLLMGSMTNKTDNLISADDRPANRLRIRVGAFTFTATLLDNATVTAFNAQLPATPSMKELNRNEKYAQLPTNLPTNAANPGTIQTGDLMLYGANTLVLFYQPLQTSYSYTRLGRVDNVQGLATALGSGDVRVTFSLE